tara:strand:- start:559 stop:858 length:300 start_codon:yes stop_codon:yes gene_type:complete
MSLVNYEKEKFKLLHSKWSKLINLIESSEIDLDDEISYTLLKNINESLDNLIIDVADLKYYIKTETNPNNNYYKNKVEEFKSRHFKLKKLLPYMLSLEL